MDKEEYDLEENSILSGGMNELAQYKQLMEQNAKAQTDIKQGKAAVAQLEKEIQTSRKSLQDNIDSTVKKRRSAVEDSFNNEIDKDEDKLKKIKNKREKAKEKGVKERIAEETSDLTAQNAELKKNVKASLKAEKLPKFCGSTYYFMLYFTKGAGEVFVCALTIIAAFLLLPGVVYILLPMEKLPHKFEIASVALVYFVVILIVFFIYKLINDKTKHKHLEALKEIRKLKDGISGNTKQIKKIARSIRKDKNEEMYGLEDFDSKISEINADIEKITADKEAALKNFDDFTKPEIISEIEGRELPKINELEAGLKEAEKSIADLEEQLKTLSINISTNYEAYLGKDFTSPEKVDVLLSYMETGRATTVAEAINIYKESDNK